MKDLKICILDDNASTVKALEYDIKKLSKKNDCNLTVDKYDGSYAVFDLFDKDDLFYDIAIVDITIGGSKVTESEILKYSGIDAAVKLHQVNKDIKVMVYTGNNMNPYIKAQRELMELFKDEFGHDIEDVTVIKQSLTPVERQDYIQEKLCLPLRNKLLNKKD